jgi:hypothetical protein
MRRALLEQYLNLEANCRRDERVSQLMYFLSHLLLQTKPFNQG